MAVKSKYDVLHGPSRQTRLARLTVPSVPDRSFRLFLPRTRTVWGCEYKFKPALVFNFLTPFYDLFGKFVLREKLHHQILSQINLGKNWKILDVGCGTGEDLIFLKSNYFRAKLYGVDADPKIIEIAKKKAKKRQLKINFKVALAEDLPFRRNFFDAVWCCLTLHHLPTKYKKQALKEMFRVLKAGRKCFLAIFSRPENPILAKIVSIQNLIEHTQDNYEGKIPQFVKEAGFKNIKESKVWFHTSFVEASK